MDITVFMKTVATVTVPSDAVKAGRGGVKPMPKPQAAAAAAAAAAARSASKRTARAMDDSDHDSSDDELLDGPLYKPRSVAPAAPAAANAHPARQTNEEHLPAEEPSRRAVGAFRPRVPTDSSDDSEEEELLLTRMAHSQVRAASSASTDGAVLAPGAGAAGGLAAAEQTASNSTGDRKARDDHGPAVRVLDSELMLHGARFCISAGSALDFGVRTGWNRDRTAVVNAANTGGVGGGGIDGAFCDRGGRALHLDRKALPYLSDSTGDRIPEGGARATGPNDYGTLYAKTVIHAVGPRYPEYGDEFPAQDEKLRSAYADAMKLAKERQIEYLGFSLLSAGIFSGVQDLDNILQIGIEAILSSSYAGLREVHMVGFSRNERQALQRVLSEHRAARSAKRKHPDESEHDRQHRRKSCVGSTPDISAASAACDYTASVRREVSGQNHVAKPQEKRKGASRLKLQAKITSATPEHQEHQRDPYAFDEASESTQGSQNPKAAAAASAQSSTSRSFNSAAPDKKMVEVRRKEVEKPKGKATGRRKLQKLASSKGQQTLAFAAPLKEGDPVELVVSNRPAKDSLVTSSGLTSKNNAALSAPSLDDLLAEKLASEQDASRRRSAIENETPLMAAPTELSAAMLAELEQADDLSDTDSDLDGGDDTELTETDVWLGTFEVQRTREWQAGEASMAEALAEKKKRLGKLHRWRLGHFTSKLRRGSGTAGDPKKFVSQRDVVMALTDKYTASTLLTEVERRDMAEEFASLRDVAVAYHVSADGGDAVQDFVLTEDKVSPQVLIDWSAKVESSRRSQIHRATTGTSYSSWLAAELTDEQREHEPSPAGTEGGANAVGSQSSSGSGSSSVSPPEKAPSPPVYQAGNSKSAARHPLHENDDVVSNLTTARSATFPSPVRPGALSSFAEEAQASKKESSNGDRAVKCTTVRYMLSFDAH
eukprot:COSAG02_NODE_5432_length_4334_cov_3.769067_2_plen_942_part_00